MAYKGNIPQSTDLLSVSQGDLLVNFTTLGYMMEPATTTMAGSGGYFKALTRSADPAALADNVLIYAKNNGSTDELYLRKPGGNPIEWTKGTNADPGEAYLPSGCQIKFGSAQTSSGSVTINYASIGLTAFSVATVSVMLTENTTLATNPRNFLRVKHGASLTKDQFIVESKSIGDNNVSTGFYWMAIGY